MDGIGGDFTDGALRFMTKTVENVDRVALFQPQNVSGVVSLASGEDEMFQVWQIKSVHGLIVKQWRQ